MSDQNIVIEVPHQRPINSTTFEDEDEATNYFWEMLAGSSEYVSFLESHGYNAGEDGVDGDDSALWEFVAHDLHALHRWTLEEAREKLAWLDTPNGGQQKMHQHLSIAVALREFIKLAEEGK